MVGFARCSPQTITVSTCSAILSSGGLCWQHSPSTSSTSSYSRFVHNAATRWPHTSRRSHISSCEPVHGSSSVGPCTISLSTWWEECYTFIIISLPTSSVLWCQGSCWNIWFTFSPSVSHNGEPWKMLSIIVVWACCCVWQGPVFITSVVCLMACTGMVAIILMLPMPLISGSIHGNFKWEFYGLFSIYIML